MTATKIGKLKPSQSNRRVVRHSPKDMKIPARLGGGVLKEMVEQEQPSGRLLRYALAYINPAIFGGRQRPGTRVRQQAWVPAPTFHGKGHAGAAVDLERN